MGFLRQSLAAAVLALMPLGVASAAPEIAISLNGTTIVDNSGSAQFGSTPQGAPVTKTFVVTNSGTTTLNLGSVIVGPGYTVTDQPSSSVAAGGTTTFDVRLNATTAGTVTAGLTLATNDFDEAPYNFALVGQVGLPAPEIAVSVDGVDVATAGDVSFGSTFQGVQVSKVFTVENVGSLTLLITNVSVPAGFTVTDQPATSIPAGASTTFTVRLNAATQSTFSGQLSFGTNDSNEDPFTIDIAGNVIAPAPEIEVRQNAASISDGGSFGFGTTGQGFPINKEFTIRNTGVENLTIGDVNVPAGFQVTAAPTSPVAPNDETTFTVQLEATSVGSFSGQLSFGNNDSNENPFNFTISGQVTTPAPLIEVTQNNAGVLDGGTFGFGTTPQNAPLTRTFTIENTGFANLTLGVVSVPAGYTVTSQPTSPVAPGDTTDFEVQLDAVTRGNFNGSISFSTNVTQRNPFNFTVAGRVTEPAPEIEVDQNGTNIVDNGTFNFGPTTQGFPISKVFTIENTGSEDLTVTNLKVPSGFSIISLPGTPVAPGDTTTFEVQFDADRVGPKSGTLKFKTNDDDEKDFNFQIGANANPQEPEIVVENGGLNVADGSAFSFAATTVGTPIDEVFDIENTGTADLELKTVKAPKGFLITVQPSLLPIIPGGTTSFTLQTRANKRGTFRGQLKFKNNDTTEKDFNLFLTSVVNAAPATFDGPETREPIYFAGSVGTAASLAGLQTLIDRFDAGVPSGMWITRADDRSIISDSVADGTLSPVVLNSERAAKQAASFNYITDAWSVGLSNDFAFTLNYNVGSAPRGSTELSLGVLTRHAGGVGAIDEGALITLASENADTELSVASISKGAEAYTAASVADDSGTLAVWYIADEDQLYVSAIGFDDPAPLVIRDFRIRAGNVARATFTLGMRLANLRDGLTAAPTIDDAVVTGSLREPIAGDLNRDGWADAQDLRIVLRQSGRRGELLTGDANADGKVDATDVRLVIEALGTGN